MPYGGGKPAKAARASSGSLERAANETGRHISGPPPLAIPAHSVPRPRERRGEREARSGGGQGGRG
eukprot:1236594-Pyramimonas_sp.AAC.1